MLGILVHGDNHFIVSGPEPSVEVARALVRQWSVIQIGGVTPAELEPWRILNQAFREDLEWAVVVPADGGISKEVRRLLEELAGRGVAIRHVAAAALDSAG